MKNQVYEYVKQFQAGDQTAGTSLIEKFNPMLKSAAFALAYEDAYDDLVLNLLSEAKHLKLENIKNPTDAGLVTYFHHLVYHLKIKLSNAHHAEKQTYNMSDLSEGTLNLFESQHSTKDEYRSLLIHDVKQILSDKEYRVIYLFFFRDIPISKISDSMGISRQAVNKYKLSAIKKLRKAWQ